MSSESATYPPDVHVITSAAFEVARAILEAEASALGTYPEETVDCPPLEATPAYTSLIARAALDEVSVLVLRLLVAAEIDRGMQRVLRKLGSAERVGGTPVDGVMAIAEGLGADPFAVLRALRPTSRLVARGLVEIIDPATPALAQRVTISPRVIDYLATGLPQEASTPFVHEETHDVLSLCPLFLRGRDDLDAANHLRRALTNAAPIWLVGPSGSGRRTLLAAVVGERGARLVCTTQRELAKRPLPTVIAACWREVLVGHAVICVHDAEAVVDRAPAEEVVRDAQIDAGLVALASALVVAQVPVVFSSTQAPPLHAFEHALQVFELAAVRMDDAIALWRRELPDVEALPDLASRFRLPPGRIVRALGAARAHAASYGRPPTALDVTQAISIGVAQQVSILGTRIEDTQTWADIILPAETLESVKEMMARVRHRHQVLDQWGFRSKMAKGLGVAALFHGPPGTGKTMVANLIAKELNQDLYQVDLSRMVSKWIGETEKNLGRVFDAAEGANVMLLFDEADSLFSKRTEVKSSNDRHSNAEINYLLQRVERFEGVCILTTNLEKSIDQAFKRRLAFRIEFPMPDERERTELWQRMVPRAAEIGDDVDFEELAQQYELAGGNIRNALLRAAFLAAEQGEEITKDLLHRAVKLEYRDAGKLGTTGTIHTP